MKIKGYCLHEEKRKIERVIDGMRIGYCLYGGSRKVKRVMEVQKINGVMYGFYESKRFGRIYAIHLKSGLSAVTLYRYLYKDIKTGFAELKKRVTAISKEKIKKALAEQKRHSEILPSAYPLNGRIIKRFS